MSSSVPEAMAGPDATPRPARLGTLLLDARVVRAAEVLLGLVFLVGALLKAADINRFIVQISYYGVLAAPAWITGAAVGTLFVETALGMLLLAGARLRGLVAVAVLLLLAFFSCLIVYGWVFHGLKDCGCFGPIEMSPGVSLGKNAALALLAALLLWASFADTASWRRRLTVGAVASLLVAGSVTGYAFRHVEPASDQKRPFAEFVFEADGTQWDLGKGEYLVALLSMTCEHCMASVPKLNDLALASGLPPVVSLCYEESEGALEEFRKTTDPMFALHSIGDRVRVFFSLIKDVPPRLTLVRDGKAVHSWDDTMPTVDEVRKVLDSGSR